MGGCATASAGRYIQKQAPIAGPARYEPLCAIARASLYSNCRAICPASAVCNISGFSTEGLRPRKPGEGRARAPARANRRDGVQQGSAPYDAPVAAFMRTCYDDPSRTNQRSMIGASSGEP